MKKLILERQNHNTPDIDAMYRMMRRLKMFLNEDVDFCDESWMTNLKIMLDFQDDDGSFKLLDSYRVESDARVDFCHMPTYICTAILMKAFMTENSMFTDVMKNALVKGLKMCCSRKLRGHGYEAEQGYRQAMSIFRKAGVYEFVVTYPDMCREFTEIIREDLRYVNVFVYGTLMTDESNHHYMSGSMLIGNVTVEGFDMFDVGYFPAVVSGNGTVKGELYKVPVEDMAALDMLEGEGSLYVRKCAKVLKSNGRSTFAFVYVYNHSVEGLEKIDECFQPYTAEWKTKPEYVWYVSYGSNMLKKRFMHYIKGGAFECGGAEHDACSDTSDPVEVKPIDIPYNMYFGNYSGSWENGGVSFLDTKKKGKALGVAYLITREQFNHVAAEENGGRFPDGQGCWYENIVSLGRLDGYEVVTITNNERRPENKPCEAYLDTLRRGICENYQKMTMEEINTYLEKCKMN